MTTTKTYTLTDGNAHETAETLADAISIAADWYDWMSDDERYEGVEMPSLDTDGIETVRDLTAKIGEWEEAIAEACGKKAFHGHGNYSVSAASEMGLSLRVTEVESEDEDDADSLVCGN